MATERKGIYYGWWIVLASFILIVMTSGYCIYSFSLFVVPVSEAMGVIRSQIVLGFTIFSIFQAILSPVAGNLIEKKGLKFVMILGAIFMGGGFILLSFASNLAIYYIGFVLLALGTSGVGPLPCTTIIAYWFDKKRGLATGIAMAGTGIGGLLAPNLIGRYLLPNMGWQQTYLIMGISLLIIDFIIILLLIKNKPSDMGLLPDGAVEIEANTGGVRGELMGKTYNEAKNTSAFWFIAIAICFLSVTQFGVLQNQGPFFTDSGVNMAGVGSALGIIGLTAAISKICFGWLIDRFSIKLCTLIGNSILIIGTVMLFFASSTSSMGFFYIYALLFGIGLGSWQPILSLQVTSLFGAKYFASIYGVVFLFKSIGEIVGPIGTSAIYDLVHSYQPAFAILIGLAVISTLLVMIIKFPKTNKK